MQSALDDLRVFDLSASAAGAWCTRLLADFGADVIVAEPPDGHPIRRLGPFDDDRQSVPARLLLANKRSIALDVHDMSQRPTLLRLLRNVDIAVLSFPPRELAALDLSYAAIQHEPLVLAHVTPHGITGPLADVPGNDLTVAARSGWASINGRLGRPPLKPSGLQVSFCTGTVAYAAVLAAIHQRDTTTGRGQEIDIAALDVMASTFSPGLLRSLYTGEVWQRRDATDVTTGPVEVADGHFALTISRAHFWREAMNVLGLPDLAEDPRWEASWYRQKHRDEYVERVAKKMRAWRKMDLFDELAVRRVIAGPVLTMEELRENEHLIERGFWTTPGDTTAVFPGAPFRMSDTPWALRHATPEPTTADVEAPAGRPA